MPRVLLPPYPSTFLGLSYYFYISIFLFTDLRGMNPAGNSGAAMACSGEGLNGTFFERCKGHPPFPAPHAPSHTQFKLSLSLVVVGGGPVVLSWVGFVKVIEP